MGCASSREADPGRLESAVQRGSREELHQILEKASSELRATREFTLLLHAACHYLQPECVALLLRKNFPLDARDGSQRTPLHVVIQTAGMLGPGSDIKAHHAREIVQLILKHCRQQGQAAVRSIDVPDSNGTPFLLAVAAQQEHIMQDLIDAGFDISARTRLEQNNALHLSVSNVHQLMSVMQAAGERNVKQRLANEPNAEGNTPLHMALMHMTDKLLHQGGAAAQLPLSAPSNMLIEDGCYIDVKNNKGQTAVSLAVDCAARALAAGIDPKAFIEVLLTITKGHISQTAPANSVIFDQLGRSGLALVHVAASLGHNDLLTSLKSRGANMDLMDSNGRLPAVIAAKAGHKQCLEHLLGNLHADALRSERSGECAAMAVLRKPTQYTLEDIRQIFRMMIQGWGAAQCQTAVPLLCLACSKGLKEVVQLLVQEGQVMPDMPGMQALLPLGATVQAHCLTPSAQLVKIAEFLIDNRANPIAEDNNRHTPLGQALESGNLDMAMVMLRKHRDLVDYAAPNGATALFLAIKQGATALADELLSFHASTGPRPGLKYIPLHLAVEERSPEMVEKLIKTEQGRQAVAVKDGYNKSILDYLWSGWQLLMPKYRGPTSNGNMQVQGQRTGEQRTGDHRTGDNGRSPSATAMLKISELILTHPNCDVNAPDALGMRPLHWAVALDQPDLVRILSSRDQEINPNLTDAEGVTPLFKAVQGGNQTLVDTMLSKLPTLDFGVTSRVPNVPQGGTVLQAAIASANVALVRMLIVQRNVRVDRRSFDLCLRLVANKPIACTEIMTELLKHRSNDILVAGRAQPASSRQLSGLPFPQSSGALDFDDATVANPLHHVVHYNNKELVQLLVLKAGRFVDEKDWQGITPLHHAVEVRAYEAAAKLVALGARVDEPSGGSNPLIAAVTKMDPQMVKELLKSKTPFDINSWDSGGYSAFSTAIRKMLAVTRKPNADDQRIADNGLDIARQLIKAGADVNEPTLRGAQWLANEADGSDSLPSTGSLPSPTGPTIATINPTYVNQQQSLLCTYEEDPMTPLVAAICVSNKPVVDMLLNVDSVDINGRHCPFPAVHMALRCAQTSLSQMSALEECHSPDTWKMSLGKRLASTPMSPLQVQTPPGPDLMRADALSILRAVANDDKVDLLMPCPWSAPGGPTVLMQLASMGGSDATKLVQDLLIRGKDLGINMADPQRAETALHIAAARGDTDMLGVLMKAKNINLNALDKQGRSPLAAAVAAGKKQAVQTMLVYGLSNVHAQGPLDPCKCGSDPRASPLAQAIAQPGPECLEALLQAVHFKQTTCSSMQSEREADVRALIEPSVRSMLGSPEYEAPGFLDSPVDIQGRPAVVAAMIALKLEHVRVLVQAGARLDLRGDPTLTTTLTKSVTGSPSRNAVPSPFSLLCQYIRNLELSKDKARLDEARRLAIYMAESETLDISDGSELQWAVMTRKEDIVEPLAARAQMEGTIDELADVYKGQKLTALELAVKLELVGVAKALISRGAKISQVMLQDPAVRQNTKLQTLLTKPPPVLPSSYMRGGKLASGDVRNIPVYDLETLAQASVSITDPAPPDATEVFRKALSIAVGAANGNAEGCPPTPMADVLEGMVNLAQTLVNVHMSSVQLHSHVFEVMRSALQSQLPTLQALQNECEERSRYVGYGTCMPRELLKCLELLGNTYVQLFKRTNDWCTMDKSALITHMLSTKEHETIRTMATTLHTQMLALAEALDMYEVLEEEAGLVAPQYAIQKSVLDASIKEAMSKDLQANVHGLYAAVLLSGDAAQQNAITIFKDAGLLYTKVTKKYLRYGVFKRLEVKPTQLLNQTLVGEGAQATVYKAMYNDQEVAYKRYPLLEGIPQAVANEAFMLSTLDHPNVLHMHGVVQDKPHCGLVVDYHEGGSIQDLYARVHDGAPSPSLLQRVTMAMQIAKGMAYLHSHKLGCIVHGDLKPTNILIASDRRAVIDFGLTSGMAQGWTATQTAFHNPNANAAAIPDDKSAIYYQAPEVQAQLLSGQKRQAASDVFAFGVLLFELMTLKPARTGFASEPTEYQNKMEAQLRPTIPQDLPVQLQFCIQLCWDQSPDRRPDFNTIADLLDEVCNMLVEQA